MHAHQPRNLNQDLEVISDLIPNIQAAIRRWLVRDLEEVVDRRLVHTNGGSELGEPAVGLVARLGDDVDVEVGLLVLEEGVAEGPVLGGGDVQHGEGGLVREGRRGVPGLDLLAQDELHAAGPFRVRAHEGGYDVVDGVELARRVRADVVEEELQRVQRWGYGGAGRGRRGEGELLGGVFWGERHFGLW